MVTKPNVTPNLNTLYQLVQSGDLADPYPHYLWADSKDLIPWILNVLTGKLNALLDTEVGRRPRANLISGTKNGRSPDHEVLTRWGRTGWRKYIHFRLYAD